MTRTAFLSALLILGTVLVAGCTSIWGGFDDPEGEVSLSGELYQSNSGGSTYYFGAAMNTGDVDVENVKVHIDVFDGSGAYLGRFSGAVTTGAEVVTPLVVEEGEEEEEIIVINDSLAVDEQGNFGVGTTVGFGRAAREEVTFSFTSITFEEL